MERIVMRKRKAAAILVVMILCGLVVVGSGIRLRKASPSLLEHVTSVAMAATDSLFAKLQGAFTGACSDVAALSNDPEFFDACAIVVRAFKSTDPAVGIVREIGKELEDSDSQGAQNACDACVQFVTEIEIELATNGTAIAIQEAMAAVCENGRLTNPADVDRCRAAAANSPTTIDNFLTDFPPLITCQQLKICPR